MGFSFGKQSNDAFTVVLSGYHRRNMRLFSPEDTLEASVDARGNIIDQSQKRSFLRVRTANISANAPRSVPSVRIVAKSRPNMMIARATWG